MKLDSAKKLILGAVVGVILKRLIDPAVDLIWGFLSKQSNKLLVDWINSVVKQAALGPKKNYEIIEYILIIAVIMTYMWLKRDYYEVHSTVVPEEKITQKQKIRGWYFMLITAVSILMYAFVGYVSVQSDQSLNLKFKQRLTIIAPKISEQQYKEFMASWASMRTVEDIIALTKKLNDVAAANNIKLP